MKASRSGDADLKTVGTAHARELSQVQQILGPAGRFIFAAPSSWVRQFITAAGQICEDPSQILLGAILEAMEQTVAAAAEEKGEGQ